MAPRTSSYWRSAVFFEILSAPLLLFIIMQTESMTLWRKTHRRGDRFLPSQTNLHVWFRSDASVACIIDTIGSRLLEGLFVAAELFELAWIGV